MRRSRLTRGAVACAAALLLATAIVGCGSSSAGSSSSTSTTHFAKTKFVLHAGLAFGAFHRYIYKPARAGAFSHPFSHKLALIKAGLAALFIRHELSLVLHDCPVQPDVAKAGLADHRAASADRADPRPRADLVRARPGQQSGQFDRARGGRSGQSITEQAPAHV